MPPDHTPSLNATKAPTRAAFAFVFVTVMLDMLALGVMLPVLPKLVIEFTGGDLAEAATVTGIFGFAFAAAQFFFSPAMGALADRFGRKPVIVLSNLGLGLDYLLMAVAPSLPWLFAGRLISGVTAATYSTAGAYIADVTEPDKRAARFGMLGAAFGLGFILGPAAGGLLGAIDLRLPFWVAAGLSLVNACYGTFVLPESLPRESRAPFTWRTANPVGAIHMLRQHPLLLGLSAVTFLFRLAHESLPGIFVLYTTERYGWGTQETGLTLAFVGIMSTLVSAALVGPAVKMMGERRALLVGLVFGISGFVVFGLAPTGWWFLLGVPLMSLWGLAGPAAQGLMTNHTDPTEQGRLQGALTSLQSIAGMMGPPLFTQVLALSIGVAGSAVLSGAGYLLAGALTAVALVLSWRITRGLA